MGTAFDSRLCDGGAFDYLARRYGRRLEAMAAEALGRLGERADRHRVEDLVQDVYCKLLASGRPLDPRRRRESQVLAYLRRTVRSAAVDGVRLAGAAKRSTGERPERRTAAPASAAAEPIDPAPDPEQHLLIADRRRRFLTACRSAAGPSLHARRDARVTALALLDGWSSREISAALGGRLRPSSVDAAVSRMRRRLAAAGVRLPRRTSVHTRTGRRIRTGAHAAIIPSCASSPRLAASTIPRPRAIPSARGG